MKIEQKIKRYLNEKSESVFKKQVERAVKSKRKDVTVEKGYDYISLIFDGSDGWDYYMEITIYDDTETLDIVSGNYDPERKYWYSNGSVNEKGISIDELSKNLNKWVKQLDKEYKEYN